MNQRSIFAVQFPVRDSITLIPSSVRGNWLASQWGVGVLAVIIDHSVQLFERDSPREMKSVIAVDRRLSDRCQCRLARQCPAHAPTRSRAQVHVRATVAGWGWGDGGTARTEDEDLRIRLTERAIETIRRRGSAAERCDSSSRNPPATMQRVPKAIGRSASTLASVIQGACDRT